MTRALALPDAQKAAMAQAGRAKVLRSYTVDAMCVATLDVYRNLVAKS
jgi:hypothetical protein